MMLGKKIISSLITVAIISGILVYSYSTDTSTEAKAFVSNVNNQQHPKEELSTKSNATSVGQVPTEAGIAQMYAQTKDMRAFVAYAKQHPESGGLAYALKGLQKCRVAKEILIRGKVNLQFDQKFPSEHFSARQRSFDYLQYLCQGFSADELSDEAVKSLREEAIQKADPFVKVSTLAGGISTLKDPQGAGLAKNQIMQAIFAYKDPLLVSDYGINASNDKTSTGSNFFLNGKSYPVFSDEGIIIHAAWRLAACEMGGDCSATNEDVITACIAFARCHSSLATLIKEDLANAGDKNGLWYERAISYARQIIDAIHRGDLQAFRPKQ